MRVLFISNFYPPYGLGGYEQWCQEVAERLSARGHEILVLTSRHGEPHVPERPGLAVARQLYLEMELASSQNPLVFFAQRKKRERENLACLRRQVAEFAPDSIVIWGMWNLPRSLAALAEEFYPNRTVYYFGDYWPKLPNQWWNYWQTPARSRLTYFPKRLLRLYAERLLKTETVSTLSFPHALFPSEFLYRAYQQAKIKVGQAHVIQGGVDTEPFRRTALDRLLSKSRDPIRLLVAGRLVADKGIHTAIEALSILTRENKGRQFHLTIAGTGDESHITSLHNLVSKLELGKQVSFLGAVAPQEMPALYCRHDLFVFPSIWQEPFGRVLVEAMSARLPVIGTAVGGAGEILRDGETGLAFSPGDSQGLAAQITRLAEDSNLRDRLASQGQAFARAQFDISRMAEAIEQYLGQVVYECRIRERTNQPQVAF